MRLPRFIKIPQYSRFDYKPVYYDERKAKLDAKIKEYQNEKEGEGEGKFKPEFKSKFHSKYTREITKKQKKAANIRFMVIMLFLIAITYIILDQADVFSYMFNILFSN